MDGQGVSAAAGVLSLEEQKSVYSVLATYFNNAEKNGMYVKGYVDGEETFDMFMKEFNDVCKTKFIVRTSWRKAASSLPRRSRYGKNERIYWEYSSGNLEVPFTGVPFVVRSCLTKHCQFGSHYYKSTAERLAKQLEESQTNPLVTPPEIKKRRNKPTKKRNCPAILHIREVVMFPDFALNLDRMFDTKYHVRQEKTNLILKLKQALTSRLHEDGSAPTLNGMQRFYINLPLPEAHLGHPQPVGGIAPTIHPMVTAKIDELLSLGIYDARHVRVIVHDHAREQIMKQQHQVGMYSFQTLYPSEHDIADYIYISSITVKPTVIVENDDFGAGGDLAAKSSADAGVKGEMEGSVNELMGLIQRCQDEDALIKVKDSMNKIIRNVKKHSSGAGPPAKRHKTSKRPDEPTTSDENRSEASITQVVIYQMNDTSDGARRDMLGNV